MNTTTGRDTLENIDNENITENPNEDWTETEMTIADTEERDLPLTTEQASSTVNESTSDYFEQPTEDYNYKAENFSNEESTQNETSPGDKLLTQFLPAWILLFSLSITLVILACVWLWGRCGRKKSSSTRVEVVSSQDRYRI